MELQTEPREVTSRCGDNVTLKCEASVAPQSDIKLFSWTFKNRSCRYKDQRAGPRCQSLGEPPRCSLALTLVNVMPADQGNYLCKLHSNTGVGHSRSVVAVHGERVWVLSSHSRGLVPPKLKAQNLSRLLRVFRRLRQRDPRQLLLRRRLPRRGRPLVRGSLQRDGVVPLGGEGPGGALQHLQRGGGGEEEQEPAPPVLAVDPFPSHVPGQEKRVPGRRAGAVQEGGRAAGGPGGAGNGGPETGDMNLCGGVIRFCLRWFFLGLPQRPRGL